MISKLAILVFLALVSVASAAEKDLGIVFDNSRNMRGIDAAGLVRTEVGRFLDELEGEVQATVVLSAETPVTAVPLVALSEEARISVFKALQNLTYQGKYVDLELALERTFHELVFSGREQAEKWVVLILGSPQDPRDVTGVQYRLHALGYTVGPIDGLMGPKTRRAIREFQRDQGLTVDGQIDRGLLVRIEETYGSRLAEVLSTKAELAGIKLISVALGEDSPLGRLLAEKTSGEYFQLSNVEALPKVVDRLKGILVKAAEIPLPTPPVSADSDDTELPSPKLEEPAPKPSQEDLFTREWMWIGFILLVLVLLALDLGVFHRKAHVIEVREALVWSCIWVGVALLFNVFIYFAYGYQWFGLGAAGDVPDGRTAAVLFFTGYVVELSLSVDNMFVIAMIFSYFAVPAQYQHRVLFWGILGALVMRAAMIVLGVALIQRFHWILYLFGAFLIITAAKMLLSRHEPVPRDNLLVQWTKRLFPITEDFVGERFTVRRDGKLMLTPLMLALITVEGSDLMFAVDSIPAIFAITEDPFIVFSSNVFAILGLRSLYFALAGIMDKLHYLKLSLALLLALIGVKMLLKDVLHTIPNITYYTLGAIALILTAGVVASLIRAKRMNNEKRHEGPKARGPRKKLPDFREGMGYAVNSPFRKSRT